ncbi:MAG: HEAT repeat domain-containing protein [Deltaproteobacteria bacterium]|nr:HEAT repeat domain-containing protein [Deltaproteobacteria bacterium]
MTSRATVALSLCLASLCLAATPALAQLKQQAVTVNSDGTVSLAGRAIGRIPLPPPPHRLEVNRPLVASHLLLHVRVIGKDDRRGELLATLPAPSRLIFAGATGPGGIDGEWSTELQIDRERILTYQRRADVTRCDDRPAYLFPMLFDWAERRFRPAMPAMEREPAITLNATRKRPTGLKRDQPLPVFVWQSSSSGIGANDGAAALSAPRGLSDGDPSTHWKASARGAFVTAQAERISQIRGLRIIPGNARSRSALAREGRPRTLLLVLSKHHRFRIRFAEDPARQAPGAAYYVELPKPIDGRCATVILQQAFGPQQASTAISELAVITELDFGQGLDPLLDQLAGEDGQLRQAAAAILSRIGASAARAAAARLSAVPVARLADYLELIGSDPDMQTVEAVVKNLHRMPPSLLGRALEILRRVGAMATAPLLAQLGTTTPAALPATTRIAAFELLGKICDDRAKSALLVQLGRGSRALRRSITRAIANCSDDKLARALLDKLGEQYPATVRADALYTLTIGAAKPLPAALYGRQLTLLDQRRPVDFELRYRLVQALGAQLEPSAVALLVGYLGDTQPQIRRLAIAQLATRQRLPHDRWAALLADPHPEVRQAAAIALGTQRSEAARRQLRLRLRDERWPLVAQPLIAGLDGDCSPATTRVLATVVRQGLSDADLSALRALSRCGTVAERYSQLIAVANSPRHRLELRTQAFALLPAPPDERAEAALRSTFAHYRYQGLRYIDGERLALAAAWALGLAKSEHSVRLLVQTLSVIPAIAMRAAAARALGRRCPPAAKGALLQATRRPGVVGTVAKRTADHCRWLGSR